MARKKGIYFDDFGEQNLIGHKPISFHPFPWKLGFNGVVDQFGDKVIDCRAEIAKVIVEAVNRQNKPTFKWAKRSKVKAPHHKPSR